MNEAMNQVRSIFPTKYLGGTFFNLTLYSKIFSIITYTKKYLQSDLLRGVQY